MLALISPAKRLDFEEGCLDLPHTQPGFLKESRALVKTLRQKSALELGQLMRISPKLADLNHERYRAFKTPFTPHNAKQAALIFAGDTYAGLDAASLSPKALDFAQGCLGILSGLYGLLRPLDLIQPYRLEMGTALRTARGDSLYTFWGERITRRVNAWTQEHRDRTVINLASQEYFKAIKPAALKGPLITPVFKELKNGAPKVIGLHAKRARGLMARAIIRKRLQRPTKLKEFCEEGYAFQPSLSSATEWVFLR